MRKSSHITRFLDVAQDLKVAASLFFLEMLRLDSYKDFDLCLKFVRYIRSDVAALASRRESSILING